MIVEMPRRGLFCGYWKSFDNRCKIGEDFIPFVRKYHGYGISFGTTYNFWYHPIEGSPGFILGYLYQLCMILQSSFLFHPLHRNKFWTLLLEMGVIPHSMLIAIFFANGSPGSVFQFGFGFALAFLVTQMHGFDLSITKKCGFVVGYAALVVFGYWLAGRSLSHISEGFRMSMNFAFAPMAWVVWCAGSLLFVPLRGCVERVPQITGAFWFLIWLAQILYFAHLGSTEATEDGRR